MENRCDQPEGRGEGGGVGQYPRLIEFPGGVEGPVFTPFLRLLYTQLRGIYTWSRRLIWCDALLFVGAGWQRKRRHKGTLDTGASTGEGRGAPD